MIQLSVLFAFYELPECETLLFYSWIQADMVIEMKILDATEINLGGT